MSIKVVVNQNNFHILSLHRQGSRVIGWIAQGLASVVPQPELKNMEEVEPAETTEVQMEWSDRCPEGSTDFI